ncbi:MAG: iron-containing redox enzyme family protein, partial [Acidobacteriota bacterium]
MVRARFSDAARPGVAGAVDRLLADADALTEGRWSVEATPPAAEPDFYLGVLRLQLRYLARAAPPALAAVRGMLRLLSDGPRSDVHSATAAVGLYEERTIRASLTAFADGIPRCAAPGSARLCSLPPPATGAVTGLDLALAAERLIRREAGRLGPQRLIAALRERPTLPLIAGCYVEQWHLTCRFPEFVAPMLSKRLDPELRRRMFDYLGEEIGHDRMERDSCLSIGLMAGELDAALPLPLCMAFADAMTHLAETDSLGYLLSIMVAEGLMGDDFRIGALLGQQLRRLGYRDPEGARRHDETNAELNHTGIVRQVMRGIPAIAPAAQDRALSNLMLMLELNRRGWDAVLDFYGKEGPVVHHGWLSARVASTGACNASSSP